MNNARIAAVTNARISWWWPAAVAAAAGLSAFVLSTGSFVWYDASYALLWGGQIAEGQAPDLDAVGSPTPHPLANVIAAGAMVFGVDAAPTVLSLIALAGLLAAFVALATICLRVGDRLLAIAAAGLLVTSGPLLTSTMYGNTDILVLALVLGALVCALPPASPLWALALLAVAGLHRPEIWLFAGFYWLFTARRLPGRGALWGALLVAAAPMAWVVFDLISTGNPLFSFTETRASAGEPAATVGDESPQGLLDRAEYVVRSAADDLRLLGWPILLAASAGLALALASDARRFALPAGLLGLNLAAYTLFGLLGLPLSERFLFPAAPMLALFAATGVLGWRHTDPGRLRRAWGAIAAAVLVGLVVVAPARVETMRDAHRVASYNAGLERDLRSLAEQPAIAQQVRRCPPLSVEGKWGPMAAVRFDLEPTEIRFAAKDPPRAGTYLRTNDPALRETASVRALPALPSYLRPVAGNRSWSLLQADCADAPR